MSTASKARIPAGALETVRDVLPWTAIQGQRQPDKRCLVMIYRNGVLSRIVYRNKPLKSAMRFCWFFNRLNRRTNLVATFQPISSAKGGA